MFFRRVIEKDDPEAMEKDETILMPHKTPPSRNKGISFGKPAFGPARPKRRRSDASVALEATTKRQRRHTSLKRRVPANGEHSDSDDEDFRGFIRVTLVSKRRKTRWFMSDQVETFDSAAERVLENTMPIQAANPNIWKESSDSIVGITDPETSARFEWPSSISEPQRISFRDNTVDRFGMIIDSGGESKNGVDVLKSAKLRTGYIEYLSAHNPEGCNKTDTQTCCERYANSPQLASDALGLYRRGEIFGIYGRLAWLPESSNDGQEVQRLDWQPKSSNYRQEVLHSCPRPEVHDGNIVVDDDWVLVPQESLPPTPVRNFPKLPVYNKGMWILVINS